MQSTSTAPLNRKETLAAINTIFNGIVGNGGVMLTEYSIAAETEEWDSLNHIRFIVELEKRFGLRIKTADIAGLKSVQRILEVLEDSASNNN